MTDDERGEPLTDCDGCGQPIFSDEITDGCKGCGILAHEGHMSTCVECNEPVCDFCAEETDTGRRLCPECAEKIIAEA